MAYILCIESATEVCSVTIHENGNILGFQESTEPFVHSTQLTLMVKDCLEQAQLNTHQLNAVAVSSGPGSYTGLRVGAAVAKGLCYSLNIPLMAIDSLKALAYGAIESCTSDDIIISSIDARRQEVYAAAFTKSMNIVFDSKAIILDQYDFSDIQQRYNKIILAGNGSDKVQEYISGDKALNIGLKSSSKFLIKPSHKNFFVRNFTDVAYYSPNYIKPPNITQRRRKLL